MEHIVALPDCGLKSAIVQYIFNHMELYHLLPWCTKSRGYDLSDLMFLLFNIKKFENFTLRIKWEDYRRKEIEIDEAFKKAFPLADSVCRVNISYLVVSPYYFFLLKWFKPRILCISAISENISTDWTEISSHCEAITICEDASTLIKEEIIKQIQNSRVNIFLTTFANVDWDIIANLAKEWSANDRRIGRVYFYCQKDSAEFVDNYRITRKLRGLAELIGQPPRIFRCKNNNPPSVIARALSIRHNDDVTKRLIIRIMKKHGQLSLKIYT